MRASQWETIIFWACVAALVVAVVGSAKALPPMSDPPPPIFYAPDRCTFVHGGDIDACAQMAQRRPHVGERPGPFRSAGVLALQRARCIHVHSTWGFHGAVFEDGHLAMSGSMLIRSSLMRYPRLVEYLDARRIWAQPGGPFLILNARQMHALGVPLCRWRPGMD